MRSRGNVPLTGAVLALFMASGCVGSAAQSDRSDGPGQTAARASRESPPSQTPGRGALRRILTLQSPTPAVFMVGGQGILWLATPGVPGMGGRLFRVELARHRVDYSVQAPTAPVALVATSTRVWVAGAHADRGGGQAFADSVLEYDVGKPSIMHSYLVSAPSGLAAAGDEAWVTHGDSAKTRGISRLKAGRASVFAPLPGQPAGTGAAPAVSICSGQLAVVVTSERSGDLGLVTVPLSAGPATSRDVGAFGTAALACDNRAVFVAVDNVRDGGLVESVNDGFRRVTGPADRTPTMPVIINGVVWTISASGPPFRLLRYAPGQRSPEVFSVSGLTPQVHPLATDGRELYVMDGNNLELVTVG